MADARDNRHTGSIERIVLACFGLAVFSGCGWSVLWNTPAWIGGSALIDDRILAIRINNGWYGVESSARFFDSPAISLPPSHGSDSPWALQRSRSR